MWAYRKRHHGHRPRYRHPRYLLHQPHTSQPMATSSTSASSSSEDEDDHSGILAYHPKRSQRDFTATPPSRGAKPSRFADAMPAVVLRVQLQHGMRVTPFYMQEGATQHLLPAMHAAHAATNYTPKLWSPAAPPHHGIPALLDKIGAVLKPVARTMSTVSGMHGTVYTPMSGRDAFWRPLAGSCMPVDTAAVRAAAHMWRDAAGYVNMSLGIVRGRAGPHFSERAHRIVTWSMYGPPPTTLEMPVVMHLCDNPACLNPEHMVWGEDKHNRDRRPGVAKAHALEQRRMQRLIPETAPL